MNELAYIGAIIDGEGCLLIGRRKRQNHLLYQPVVTIASKDKSLIDFVHSYFSGPISLKKDIYSYWSLTGFDKIKNFLEQVLPYILIKRQQALLLLEYVKSREIGYHKGKEVRGYTTDEVSLYEQIKKLKKEYPVELLHYHFTQEEKWHYLAGLIDGEGSVRIAKAVHQNKYGNKRLHLVPQISIANTDNRMMDFLVKEFGGFFHAKKREGKWRTIYQWHMQGLKEDFFKNLNGKLILKQEQLKLILDFIQLRKRKEHQRYDEKEIEVFLKIRELNKKGKEEYTYEDLKQYSVFTLRSPRKLFMSRDELEKLYHQEHLSIRAIAKRFGVHYNAIHTRMRTYGILRRISNQEKNKISLNQNQAVPLPSTT